MRILGISGWSGCGKTTLIVALIPRLRALGVAVSTLKHAHHDVDLDRPGKDTYLHREAGAQEVILSNGRRWALLHELREEPEPTVVELLRYLTPVDLVLVEGWKNQVWPQLEVWRPTVAERAPRFPTQPAIMAVASAPLLDPADYGRPGLPALALDDPDSIARFIVDQVVQR